MILHWSKKKSITGNKATPYLRSIILLFVFYLPITGVSQTKLNVHGYLTQAFAISDGHQILGIPSTGTSDYRTLALQFRFDLDEASNFVIQLSHKKTGKSPLAVLEKDIALDWAFFQHKFSNQYSIKVGKIQIPFGIYNEVRDVGVLLPFYGLPYAPYGEGGYMSETVDGLSITFMSEDFSPWNFEFSIYAGHWSWSEWFNTENIFSGALEQQVGIAQIEKGVGGQFVLNTPVDGLRLIAAGQFGRVVDGLSFSENGILGPKNFYDGLLAIDADFEKCFFRSEFLFLALDKTDVQVNAGYAQAGYYFSESFSLNIQGEMFRVNYLTLPPILSKITGKSSFSFDFDIDYAIGFKYNFSSNYTLKLEGHWNKGYLVEEIALSPFQEKAAKTLYSILSLSTSF
jgi:hypothetical protein